MAEEKMTCSACGCACSPVDSAPAAQANDDMPSAQASSDDMGSYHEETKLAVLIALVPAMTMTVFNLMGLV